MADQKKTYIYALSSVLLWSTVASAFKLSLRHMPPAHLLLFSSAVSTVLLAAILLFQGRLVEAFRSSGGEYLRSFAFGLLNPFGYYLVLFKAYDLLPGQEAQALNYTWAITLTLLAVPVLKQKLRLGEVLATGVSYFGVIVIATHGAPLSLHFANPAGVALALASTLIWAIYWIFNVRDSRDPLTGLFLNTLFGFLFVLGFCLLLSDLRLPPLRGLLGAAYVGVFEMGIAFLFWLQALKFTESTAKISNLIFISPFISLVFLHFIVGEEILPSTFVGLILIIAGLTLQQLRPRRRNRETPEVVTTEVTEDTEQNRRVGPCPTKNLRLKSPPD